MTIVAQIIDRARAAGIMIATAESCTAGMVAASLTEIPGASDVFERGFITYTNAAKQQMINVKGETLDQFGAVSEPVACEMAEGAVRKSEAQIAISVTGIAGPGGSAHKPEGRVCFALAYCDHMFVGRKTKYETVEFGPLGRENVRIAARDHALLMVLAAVS